MTQYAAERVRWVGMCVEVRVSPREMMRRRAVVCVLCDSCLPPPPRVGRRSTRRLFRGLFRANSPSSSNVGAVSGMWSGGVKSHLAYAIVCGDKIIFRFFHFPRHIFPSRMEYRVADMKDSACKKCGLDPARIPTDAELELVAYCFDVPIEEAKAILESRTLKKREEVERGAVGRNVL